MRELSDPGVLETPFASTCFQVLFNRVPEEREIFAFNALLNLTVTNGPGALSAKGAKESVSARNHIATAYAGFMTNTGLAHGGNGFEAIGFLRKMFSDADPYRISPPDLEAALKDLAIRAARKFALQKKDAKGTGVSDKIPCINHPVFRGKPENHDPREVFLRDLLAGRGIVNPFLEFYHHLVKELRAEGVTGNTFCVNVDAAIACIALDLFWRQLDSGELGEKEAQEIVFIMFLYGRMAGASAEIADHLGRGLDLDCRTPLSELVFLS
jgi:citrate synthase